MQHCLFFNRSTYLFYKWLGLTIASDEFNSKQRLTDTQQIESLRFLKLNEEKLEQ